MFACSDEGSSLKNTGVFKMYCSNCDVVMNDTLYKLGVSTDLKPYYDSIKGDGAWDKLSEEVQYSIVRSSERGIEGFMGDYTEAFDEAIDDAVTIMNQYRKKEK